MKSFGKFITEQRATHADLEKVVDLMNKNDEATVKYAINTRNLTDSNRSHISMLTTKLDRLNSQVARTHATTKLIQLALSMAGGVGVIMLARRLARKFFRKRTTDSGVSVQHADMTNEEIAKKLVVTLDKAGFAPKEIDFIIGKTFS